MLLSNTEITLQIHILTFSLVLTTCLSTVIRILWHHFFSHSRCIDHALTHVTQETYRVSPYFWGSVPPRICSLVSSDSEITRNRVKGFWFALTVWMYYKACANVSSKKSASHTTCWTPTPPISLCCIRETLDMGILRQYSLSLTEARTLYINIVVSTQIHIIVYIPSNQHQVPFFRSILLCKQGLLITLHLVVYCDLYCQKHGFCSGRVMLIVILRTLRQPFPCQL